MLILSLGPAPEPAAAQPEPAAPAAPEGPSPYEGRLIKDVRFEGLRRMSDQYARNQIRTAPGQPLSWESIRSDLRRLERLGEFRQIQADLLVDDDLNVIVLFKVVEAPIVRSVDVVGNRQISDEDIRTTVSSVISLMAGVPIDEYQIGRAQRAIEEMYRNRGYYNVQVTVDESELESTGGIIFRVREGERIKVTGIRFQGNSAFQARQIQTVIKTRRASLLQKGAIDDTVLDDDVGAIIRYYVDRGYLDVRASRQIQPSPDGREAIITFFIDEGPQYTLRSIGVRSMDRRPEGEPQGPHAFSREQIVGVFPLKPGDVFGQRDVRSAADAVRDAYRKIGYVDARVDVEQNRDPDAPVVDVVVLISEGLRYRAGMVYIQGNDLTQQKVIRRQVTITPDRWLDATGKEETERNLRATGLFVPGSVKVTIQPEDPAAPGYRDVLVEVEETNTGSLSFGAAVDSDLGLVGAVSLTQRNFDILDFPDSFGEFIRGRAFRGAGQTFSITLQPGFDQSNYAISFSDPYVFDTEYSLGSSLYYRQRDYDDYDETRFGTRWRIGRRFGTRWTGGVALRAESVDISDIQDDASTELLETEGRNFITSIGFDLSRITLDNRVVPTKGTITGLEAEQFGAMGGDYTFTRLSARHQAFVPISEDYLGRKTVLSVLTRMGYIPQDDEAPVFETFYLGGRSFRGFGFRGVAPHGVQPNGMPSDDRVGGEWLFFLGAEIEKPIFQRMVSGVVFIDSGTILDDPGFEKYRVSVGLGLRIYVQALGQAPLAFDFGFPIIKEDDDDTQLFSFTVDVPIR